MWLYEKLWKGNINVQLFKGSTPLTNPNIGEDLIIRSAIGHFDYSNLRACIGSVSATRMELGCFSMIGKCR